MSFLYRDHDPVATLILMAVVVGILYALHEIGWLQ